MKLGIYCFLASEIDAGLKKKLLKETEFVDDIIQGMCLYAFVCWGCVGKREHSDAWIEYL